MLRKIIEWITACPRPDPAAMGSHPVTLADLRMEIWEEVCYKNWKSTTDIPTSFFSEIQQRYVKAGLMPEEIKCAIIESILNATSWVAQVTETLSAIEDVFNEPATDVSTIEMLLHKYIDLVCNVSDPNLSTYRFGDIRTRHIWLLSHNSKIPPSDIRTLFEMTLNRIVPKRNPLNV